MTMYRTTLTIWTERNPVGRSLTALAEAADSGEALSTERMTDALPTGLAPLEVQEFFVDPDDWPDPLEDDR